MAFEKIVTSHGNFAEVARKAVNAANQIRTRLFGKVNPQERVAIIREHANMLLIYADALEMIWETEKRIQDGTYTPPAGGYIKLTKEMFNENILKSNGDGEGSAKRSLRNGNPLSVEDSPGQDSGERPEVSDD